MSTTSNFKLIPVLPLRDLVVFPKMVVPLFVGRPGSVNALNNALQEEHLILLVAQKNSSKEEPKFGDLFKVGVVGKVSEVLRLQNSNIKILVAGIERVKINKYIMKDGTLFAEIEALEDKKNKKEKKEIEVLKNAVWELFEKYAQTNKNVSEKILESIKNIEDLRFFCDAISSHIPLQAPKKQELLECREIDKKLEKLLIFISSVIELFEAESRIKDRVKDQIEKNQKDYYLNEQLKAIRRELGEQDFKDELNTIAEQIKATKFSPEAKEKAETELKKLRTMSLMSSEAGVVRNYLEWLITLPWNKPSKLKKDLKIAQEVLDNEHYGLEQVKERVIEYLAVTLRTNAVAGPIICLVGPPGVGKTSLAKSIATSTGREFVKISLGGLDDESEIKGHRRTYIGAMPGKLLQAMKRAKTSNPLILLDEIDKMGSSFRGDPASALLEALDPEQNNKFMDHYLEVDYDLSKVMFVATANTTDITAPLLDRMEIIKLSGYTEDEKLQIATRYLVPKQQKAHGIVDGEVLIKEEAILNIIRYYTREAGVRNLDRSIAKITRKALRKILAEQIANVTVDADTLDKSLGVKKYLTGEIEEKSQIGITNGLAYTEVGGELLMLEAVVVPGKGEVKITGKLGEVMKESVLAAISYIRSKAAEFGIPQEKFKDNDIHLHVPEGAVPKDGPSAGIGIFTSIVSALNNIPVKRDIAMTGEITLRGRVLPIGGLREKLLAALRGGVKTVLIPLENVKDLEEIPAKIKDNLNIVPVCMAAEVLPLALSNPISPIIQPLSDLTQKDPNAVEVIELKVDGTALKTKQEVPAAKTH